MRFYFFWGLIFQIRCAFIKKFFCCSKRDITIEKNNESDVYEFEWSRIRSFRYCCKICLNRETKAAINSISYDSASNSNEELFSSNKCKSKETVNDSIELTGGYIP